MGKAHAPLPGEAWFCFECACVRCPKAAAADVAARLTYSADPNERDVDSYDKLQRTFLMRAIEDYRNFKHAKPPLAYLRYLLFSRGPTVRRRVDRNIGRQDTEVRYTQERQYLSLTCHVAWF